MQEKQISYDMFTPFGPRIMKSSVPQNIVDELNKKTLPSVMFRKVLVSPSRHTTSYLYQVRIKYYSQ